MLVLLILNQFHLQHRFRQMHKQLHQQHGEALPKQNKIVHPKEGQTLQPNTVNITEFFTEEFKRGLSYNSLVSARSALGHCLSCDIIHHSTVFERCQ